VIKKGLYYFFIAALLTSGCGSLLPSTKQTSKSHWDSFEDAKAAFDKITPYKTTAGEMQELGFDPFSKPNIKILNYVDIINRFMPNSSIKKEDLDQGIQECINAKSGCQAYEFAPQVLKSRRHGNVLLDLLNFRRNVNESGWRFEAFIVLVDNIVVYKMWGGNPIIDQNKESKNPLGPLQNSGDIFREAVMPDM
jgi:hypothetical protein